MKRGLLAALAALLIAAPAAAETGASLDRRAQSAEELQRIEAEMEAARAHVEALKKEAEALADQSQDLRVKLVDTASKVQDQERRLSDIESRLFALLDRETNLVEQLKTRKATIARLIGALESLSLNRAPTLGVSPDDAAAAARSAMLLGTIIPSLRSQAKGLESELAELTKLREGIRSEQHDAVSAAKALEVQRSRLESQLAELADRRLHAMATAQQEQTRLAALAQNAKDLRSFVEELGSRGLASVPRPRPGDLASLPGPFNRQKGSLRMPVAGEIAQGFGAARPDGSTSRGLVFATRENAQVVSPCSGTVVFSGPFRGYGLLLIIQADDGYHFVLSGMARIDAVAQQKLLSGEPVGTMGESASSPGSNGPELYVELRRRGEPVDPRPWLAPANGRVSG